MRVFIITVISIVVIALGIIVMFSPTTAKPVTKKAPHAPCSSNSTPCIKITQQDGTVYKLNDFKFLANRCISFISLPDKQERTTCDYKLDWIGMPQGQDV